MGYTSFKVRIEFYVQPAELQEADGGGSRRLC